MIEAEKKLREKRRYVTVNGDEGPWVSWADLEPVLGELLALDQRRRELETANSEIAENAQDWADNYYSSRKAQRRAEADLTAIKRGASELIRALQLDVDGMRCVEGRMGARLNELSALLRAVRHD